MAFIPPWITGLDVIRPMSAGAQLGLSVRSQNRADQEMADQRARAADALNMQFAQLSQRAVEQQEAREIDRERAAESLRQHNALQRHWAAQEQQAANTAKGLEAYRTGMLNRPTAMMRDLDYMGTLSEQAGKVMTPQERAEYLQTLGQGKLLGPKRTTRVNPDGTMEIIEGGADGGLTTAVKTELQKQSIQRQDPISIIFDLQKTIQPSDVGVRGVVGEFIDRGVAQVNPQAASKRRIESRHSMRELQTALYKTMRSDSNITDEERNKIEKMTPQLGALVSLPAL